MIGCNLRGRTPKKDMYQEKLRFFQPEASKQDALRNGVKIKKAKKYNPEVIVLHVEHKSAKRTRRMKKAPSLCD